jgi:hypothetical protein
VHVRTQTHTHTHTLIHAISWFIDKMGLSKGHPDPVSRWWWTGSRMAEQRQIGPFVISPLYRSMMKQYLGINRIIASHRDLVQAFFTNWVMVCTSRQN